MSTKLFTTLIAAYLFFFYNVELHAAAKVNKKNTPKKEIVGFTPTTWKQWYTFTREGAPFGYYLEEVELRTKQEQISVSQHWWEKAEQGIEEIYIGSVSKNDSKLTPIAFFVERKKNNGNYNIDGRIKNSALTVKIKKNNQNNNTILNPVENNDIFSNFLPMLLSNARKNKSSGTLSYRAILEDGANSTYQPEAGTAQWKSENKKISKETCYLFTNNFQNLDSEWWITAEGKVCKITIPNLGAELKQASEQEALRFLGTR